ncbi:MAG TPA: Ig-like domain-containing protein, partial [bacterium]|nr:Ig-like domain-containing protein [bacterium]
IAVDIQWSAGDTVATIVPTASLMPDSDYTIVVSRDIQDTEGRTLTGFYTSTFHTGTAGLLIYVVVNDADDLNALHVVAYFREAVDTDSVNGGTFYVTYENEFGGTTAVPGDITWNAGCDIDTNVGCITATFTPDMYALYSCGERSSDPQFALPLNTQFTVHLSTYIRNANWDSDQLHVETMGLGDEFLHEFKTPPSISILGTKYQNAVVGLTNLSGATEVPVNAEFIIAFREKIDPASANGDTILLEDDRGTDGSVTAASSQFTVAKIGTFLAGRDEGKLIDLFGTEAADGLYAIASVVDDRTVTLAGITFTATTTDLNWSRYWAPGDLDITTENDDTEIHVKHAKRLIHHSEYLGFHAAVTAGSNIVTIPKTADNYRVATYRDLGKYLVLYGTLAGNTVKAIITGVNETGNTLTTDTTFTNAESDIAWRITDDRDHHRLIIKGRTYRNTTDYLRAADGNPFAGISRYTFITSPETHIRFSPESAGTNVLENPIVIFSRPIHRDSVSQDTLYLIQGGELNTSLTAMESAHPTSLMVIPTPALVNGTTLAYLYVTEGVWDYRGNPVIAAMKSWNDIGNAPATSAITPDTALTIAPAGAAAVKGHQHFTINWPDGGPNHKYSMAPASINDDSIYLDQINKSGANGTVTINSPTFTVGTAGTFAPGDVGKVIRTSGSGTAGNNGRRTILTVDSDTSVTLDIPFAATQSGLAWALLDPIPFALYFVPEQTGNVAEIYPTRFIRSGAGAIQLTVRKKRIANIYTIASTDADTVTNFTVENTAPGGVVARAHNDTGVLLALSTISGTPTPDITAKPAIRVSFNEAMDPASFTDGTTVTLTDKDNAVKALTLDVAGSLAVLTPKAALSSAGNPYTLTITGVTDTAGNAYAGTYNAYFNVETTLPSVIPASVRPADFATGVSVDAVIKARFSEMMTLSTITRSTVSTDGTFRVTRGTPPACGADAENDVFGCLALDSSSRRVTFVPLPNDLHDETDYTLAIASTVADLAGNTLGADFTSAFDTLGGDDAGPMPLCADIDLAGGQVIDLYFSEAIDALTADGTTIFIYEVESGVVLPGLFTIETVDSYPVVRFTATGSFGPGVEYGLIVTRGVMGDDGNPIVEEFRTFFTGTL